MDFKNMSIRVGRRYDCTGDTQSRKRSGWLGSQQLLLSECCGKKRNSGVDKIVLTKWSLYGGFVPYQRDSTNSTGVFYCYE
eukprot:scaffold8529_cov137-Cylindrotheca_fusiformis.AAC.12